MFSADDWELMMQEIWLGTMWDSLLAEARGALQPAADHSDRSNDDVDESCAAQPAATNSRGSNNDAAGSPSMTLLQRRVMVVAANAWYQGESRAASR